MTEPSTDDFKVVDIPFPEFEAIIKNGETLVIDVREPHEVAEARVIAKTFLNIPLSQIESAFKKSCEEFKEMYKFEKPGKDDDIAFICRSGRRTKLALKEMYKMGYERPRHFDGGTLLLIKDHGNMVLKSENKQDSQL